MSTATSNPTTFAERCAAECTRDVVFLLQVRRWIHNGLPDGYDSDGESIWKNESNDDPDAPAHLQWSDLDAMERDDGMPYRIERWDTESVWLTREEAEAFGKAKAYNYLDGWRVYGVPSNGKLPAVIRQSEAIATLTDAAEAARVELMYLVDQLNVRPKGSVRVAYEKLSTALGIEPKKPRGT